MSAARSTFAEIGKVLRDHKRFAVLSHVRPDGDALGSQLALALSLKELGKDVRIWNEDGMLEKYSFLPHADLLTKPPSAPEDVDVAVALDTAIQNRLGTAFESVRSAKTWINIDHHPSNPGYGDVVYIDPNSPATGQIIYELIKSEKLPLTREIAEKSLRIAGQICIYTNDQVTIEELKAEPAERLAWLLRELLDRDGQGQGPPRADQAETIVRPERRMSHERHPRSHQRPVDGVFPPTPKTQGG